MGCTLGVSEKELVSWKLIRNHLHKLQYLLADRSASAVWTVNHHPFINRTGPGSVEPRNGVPIPKNDHCGEKIRITPVLDSPRIQISKLEEQPSQNHCPKGVALAVDQNKPEEEK